MFSNCTFQIRTSCVFPMLECACVCTCMCMCGSAPTSKYHWGTSLFVQGCKINVNLISFYFYKESVNSPRLCQVPGSVAGSRISAAVTWTPCQPSRTPLSFCTSWLSSPFLDSAWQVGHVWADLYLEWIKLGCSGAKQGARPWFFGDIDAQAGVCYQLQ